MYCSQCGGQNPDNAQFCGACGNKLSAPAPAPQQPVYAPPPPPQAVPQQPMAYQAPQQPAYQAPAPTTMPQPGYGPGVQPPNYARTAYVPSHMGLAIFTTICCCIPLGVVAIMFAAQVKGRVHSGDLAGAQRAAGNAQLWAILGIILGAIVLVIWGIVQGLQQGVLR